MRVFDIRETFTSAFFIIFLAWFLAEFCLARIRTTKKTNQTQEYGHFLLNLRLSSTKYWIMALTERWSKIFGTEPSFLLVDRIGLKQNTLTLQSNLVVRLFRYKLHQVKVPLISSSMSRKVWFWNFFEKLFIIVLFWYALFDKDYLKNHNFMTI